MSRFERWGAPARRWRLSLGIALFFGVGVCVTPDVIGALVFGLWCFISGMDVCAGWHRGRD